MYHCNSNHIDKQELALIYFCTLVYRIIVFGETLFTKGPMQVIVYITMVTAKVFKHHNGKTIHQFYNTASAMKESMAATLSFRVITIKFIHSQTL